MAGTFTHLGIHFVFSTKNRIPMIDETIQTRLHEYIGGIIRELKGRQVIINSMPDHVHLYTYIPKTISISEFMQKVKGSASKWVSENFNDKQKFTWQEGYGAFTVSKSNENKIIEYIQNQKEHHRQKSFQEEFIDFLRINGIEYDERYIWK